MNNFAFKIPVEVNSKKFLISPYNTKREKDILLMSSFGIFNVNEVLRLLDVDIEIINSLSLNEKKCLLYKFRETSVGDEIEIKFKCTNCAKTSEGVLETTNFDKQSLLNDDDILKIDKEVTEENLKDFLKNDIDILELDLDEYFNLIQRVKDNQTVFNFIKSCKCLNCKTDNFFDIGDEKYIIEHLSENNLHSLYKTYNNMIMFGNMSKQDIDSMYPFERTIFIGLINKTKEDMNK